MPSHTRRPQRFSLDLSQLEGNFRGAQMRTHPDLSAALPPSARASAAAASSALNVAYRALRDPLQRAQHLLELQGLDALGETAGSKHVPPQLLEEVMEAREAVSAAATTLPELLALQRWSAGAAAQCERDLGAAFDAGKGQLACDITVALSYYLKIAAEAGEAVEARGAASAGGGAGAPARQGAER